ncbi:hypothetical protein DFJ74DRAFT_732547 [Hyaloraphidium curvatum]|nr:hypothetical protein DFJ74DRAFT_732547 [Hyaloraphidium curvatum]
MKRGQSLAELREAQAAKRAAAREAPPEDALAKAARDGVTSFKGLFAGDAPPAAQRQNGLPPARPFASLARSATVAAPSRPRSFNPFDQRSTGPDVNPASSRSTDPWAILDSLSNPPYEAADGNHEGAREAEPGHDHEERENAPPGPPPQHRGKELLRSKAFERTNSCPPLFAALSTGGAADGSSQADGPRRNQSVGRLTSALNRTSDRRASSSTDFMTALKSIDEEREKAKALPLPVPEVMTETSVPPFWQLYRKVVVSSPNPLIDLFAKASWAQEVSSMSSFAGGPSADAAPDAGAAIPPCLHSWEFHERPGPASAEVLRRAFGIARDAAAVPTMRGEDRKELEWWLGVEERWKAAFQSLYGTYRSGDTPYFYCIGADTCALFLGKGYSPANDLQVIMSKTTAGFREKLDGEGIVYEILRDATAGQPASSSTVAPDEAHAEPEPEEDGDASDDEETADPTATIGPKFRARTGTRLAIRCSGARNVHSLCDFLLNWKDPQPQRRAEYGTPCLVSPRLFLHASLRRAQLADRGVSQRPVREGAARTLADQYQVELLGAHMLPTDLRAWIARLVALGVEAEVQLADVDPSTEALCAVAAEDGGRAADAGQYQAGWKVLSRVDTRGGLLASKYRSRRDS